MDKESKVLQAALEYVAMGFHVIPLYAVENGICNCEARENCDNPGKHPRVSWTKYQDDPATSKKIRGWWKYWPKSNVGIVTGKGSGIIVLDVDGPMGEKTLKDRKYHVPATVLSRTGGSGWHFFFKHPGFECRNFSSKIGETILPKIDFRGDGGLIVAPPSKHKSGNLYEWAIPPDDSSIIDAPEWLLKLIKTQTLIAGNGFNGKKSSISPEEWQSDIPEGQRNDQLTRRAGSLLAKGIPAGEVLTMVQALNRNHCRPPLQEKEVETLVLSIVNKESRKPVEKGKNHFETSNLPQIIVTDRPLRALSDQAVKALEAANNPPSIFVRAGELTKIAVTEDKDRNNIPVNRPILKTMSEASLRGRMARTAEFMKARKKEYYPCSPPLDVVRDIIALDKWPFPLLQGIVQAPILRQDGSIVIEPGYDSVTSLYYVPDKDLYIPNITENPSGQNLDKAVSLLKEVIYDFPFDCKASQTNALAAMLTPVLRDLIPGPVPMAVIDKPQQGTGASLLADIISSIATGKSAYMTSPPEGREREEEWRKRVTSILLEGRPIVVVDNVEGMLRSPTLGTLLTCTYWQDRALGRNELISLQHRTVWFVTGNNLRLGGDLPRRCYMIRLDAKQARPWQRNSKDFRHPELVQWVRETRGEILGAILTLAKSWIMKGMPLPDNLPILGSFEGWTRTIGGILAFAGVEGFLRNLEELYERTEEDEGWEGFLSAWYEKWREQRVTTAEIKRELTENDDFLNTLPGDLDHTDKSFTKRMGHALKARNGRHYTNGLYIEKSGTMQKVTAWRVRSRTAVPGKTGCTGSAGSLLPSRESVSENFIYREGAAKNPQNPQNPPFGGEDVAAAGEREVFEI